MGTFRNINLQIKKPLLLVLGMALLGGCLGGGDTDGGSAKDAANDADGVYVADGGAGATLTIDAPDTMAVGEIAQFKLHLMDPSGQPLAYIRLFCESEKGIAIIEPSSGGVAFEHTSARGIMSGYIGGLVPGSYIIECRAPEGFGLVVRKSIIITGPVPENFVGFPGAAGGNLGGGRLVDDSEWIQEVDANNDGIPDNIGDLDDDNDGSPDGVRVSKVEFNDGANRGPSGPIDIVPGTCNNGTPADTTDDFPEPYFFNHYFAFVKNNSEDIITIGSIGFTIQNGGPGTTSTQGKTVSIKPGEEKVIEGVFTDSRGTGTKYFAGSSTQPVLGTYRVDVVLTGTRQGGGSLSIAREVTVTFDNVNNCENAGDSGDYTQD